MSNAGFVIWLKEPGFGYGPLRFAIVRGSFVRIPSGCTVTAHVPQHAAIPGGLLAISLLGWLTASALAVLHQTGSAHLPWAPYAAGAFAITTAYTLYRAKAAAVADDLCRRLLEIFEHLDVSRDAKP